MVSLWSATLGYASDTSWALTYPMMVRLAASPQYDVTVLDVVGHVLTVPQEVRDRPLADTHAYTLWELIQR